MDRSDLIARANKLLGLARKHPALARMAGLTDDDFRAGDGIVGALNAQPELADPFLPYVNRAHAEPPGRPGGDGARATGPGFHTGCPWSIKIDGVYYSCIHPDGMQPHTHQYRGPDGQVHDAPSCPDEPPAPGW